MFYKAPDAGDYETFMSLISNLIIGLEIFVGTLEITCLKLIVLFKSLDIGKFSSHII